MVLVHDEAAAGRGGAVLRRGRLAILAAAWLGRLVEAALAAVLGQAGHAWIVTRLGRRQHARRSIRMMTDLAQAPRHERSHHGHGHSHGLIDPSIKRSRAGVRAVLLALLVLGVGGRGATRRVRRVGVGRAARGPDPQRRRRRHGDPARDRVRAAQRARRALGGARRRLGDLRLSACVAGFEAIDRLVAPAAGPPPRRARRRRRDRLRRQLARRAIVRTRAGRAARQPGADRRRQPRARRRLRLARGDRERASSSRSARRSPTR